MESMFAIIAKELGVKTGQVEAAVTLLDEGNTVPFIARYRKEVTGELQDEQLRTVEERIKYLRNLEARRQEIINAITEQDKMTDELMASLMRCLRQRMPFKVHRISLQKSSATVQIFALLFVSVCGRKVLSKRNS